MENNELKIFCINGYNTPANSNIDAIKKNYKDIKSINYNEYSYDQLPTWPNTKLMNKAQVENFCQNLQKNLAKENLNISENTFFDLFFHGTILDGNHVIVINKSVLCKTEDLVYNFNKIFGAKKFSINACHSGEASKDLIESIYNNGNKFPEGVSVSTYVEPQHSAWIYLCEDSILHSLHNMRKYFADNPTTELPAIVRFAHNLLHDHEISYYTEITPAYQGHTQHIQYKSANLFTINNIENWVNLYKEDPTNFNFKSVIENYLSTERQKLIEAFKAGYPGSNVQEKTDILNSLEALKDTTLTHDEYQHFVLGRLVYRASVTDEQEARQHEDLFKDFIKLLDNQGIDFEVDLNIDRIDGNSPANKFFDYISSWQKKTWFNDLLKNYLKNKKDEGYETDEEANTNSSLYAALHPEKFHTPDETMHEDDVHIDGIDDDHSLSDEII